VPAGKRGEKFLRLGRNRHDDRAPQRRELVHERLRGRDRVAFGKPAFAQVEHDGAFRRDLGRSATVGIAEI